MSVLEHYLTHILLQPITPSSSSSSTSSSTTNNTANNNSIFHAVHPPHISPLDYFRRLTRYAFCSRSVFVSALYHIRTLANRNIVSVNILSIHRLLVTAVVVAVKSLDDVLYDNAHFAKVGGLDLQELNVLELDMLKALDFRAGVHVEEYQRFEQCLLAAAFWNGKDQEEEEVVVDLSERLKGKGFEHCACNRKNCCGLWEKKDACNAVVMMRLRKRLNGAESNNNCSSHDDDDLSVSDDDDDDDDSVPMECTKKHDEEQGRHVQDKTHDGNDDDDDDDEEPGSPTSSMDVSFGAD